MSEKTETTIRREARRDFVVGVVPLSLWLAHRLWRGGMPLPEAVTARTNLYRLTCLWDGTNHPARPPAGWRDTSWDDLLRQLEALFGRYADTDDTAVLESEGLDLLWPFLEPRLDVDARGGSGLQKRPFGFFTYNHSPQEHAIALHLANPFAPRSPFADPQARAAELGRLVGEAAAKDPDLLRVSCGSWLNSFPPFLEFFPPSWAASASAPSPLAYHYGWWGQFLDRAGRFHVRNGEYLRRTGQFRYPCVRCTCSLNDLRTHLHEKFGVSAP